MILLLVPLNIDSRSANNLLLGGFSFFVKCESRQMLLVTFRSYAMLYA